MVSIASAIRRAHALAAHYQKVWHVVEVPGTLGFPVGVGHIYDGDALECLAAAVHRRIVARVDDPWVAMHCVFPDGSSHRVAA